LIAPLRKLLTDDPNHGIVDVNDISAIFSNLETLYQLNKELLRSLEERMRCWSEQSQLGDIFVKMVSVFFVSVIYFMFF
jgi:hypothetical protein